MRNFFQRYNLITWVGIGLALLLIISAILRVLTPNQVKIPQPELISSNLDGSTSDFELPLYEGGDFLPPIELTIYRAQSGNSSAVIKNIVDLHNLSQSPNLDTLWTNNQGQFLNQDIYSKRYQLSLGENVGDSIKLLPESELRSLATSEIRRLFPNLLLNPTGEVEYIHEEHGEPDYFAEENDPSYQQADLIKIYFGYEVGEYEVIAGKDTEPPFSVTLNKFGDVRRVDFAPLFINLQEAGTNETISINESLENIANNNASLISYGFSYDDPQIRTDLSRLSNIVFDQVQLEYRYDPESELVYPYYRFSGTAQDGATKNISVIIITPAVAVGE